jgi:hypothetical protein
LSYSGNPNDSELDAVRFLIQDTDTSAEVLADAEIQYLLDQNGAPLKAAIVAADALANRYATDSTTYRIGNVEVRRSQRAAQFRRRAEELRNMLLEQGVTLYAGGISVADKADVVADTDRVSPAISVGIFENT